MVGNAASRGTGGGACPGSPPAPPPSARQAVWASPGEGPAAGRDDQLAGSADRARRTGPLGPLPRRDGLGLSRSQEIAVRQALPAFPGRAPVANQLRTARVTVASRWAALE